MRRTRYRPRSSAQPRRERPASSASAAADRAVCETFDRLVAVRHDFFQRPFETRLARPAEIGRVVRLGIERDVGDDRAETCRRSGHVAPPVQHPAHGAVPPSPPNSDGRSGIGIFEMVWRSSRVDRPRVSSSSSTGTSLIRCGAIACLSVRHHGNRLRRQPLSCASAIRVRQQNGLRTGGLRRCRRVRRV